MAGLWSFVGLGGCQNSPTPFGNDSTAGLGTLAARKSRFFGAAVQSWQLRDPAFTDALKREVNLLVPETELKWGSVHPAPHHFDFRGYHRLAAFAVANRMAMRGHTLLWHNANPAWLEPALTDRKTARKILRNHIHRVIAETAPIIRNWDVVNEAIDPYSSRPDGLRDTLWLRGLGDDYVAEAFHITHEAGPDLTLTYNEFGLDYDTGAARAKRRLLLKLLEKYRAANVPIHALGLQSHLECHKPLGGRDFTAFLKEVRALGITIAVTELDLDLQKVPGRPDDKSIAAQNYVRAWLDLVQASGAVDMVLTWGLSDRYSWLNNGTSHVVGALPLDENLNHAPLWETLQTKWLGDKED